MGVCRYHGPYQEEEEEGIAIGCPKCKKKRRVWTLEPSSGMLGASRWERHGKHVGTFLGQEGAICTPRPPTITPDMNCQKTQDGNIICSNNVIYSADCPYAPAVNYPGVAPVLPGANAPKAPPYKTAEEIAAGSPAAAPAGIPGGPTVIVEPPSSALPVAGMILGGAAIAGLAYLVFGR